MKSRYLFFAVICIVFGVISESGFAQQPPLQRGREFWVGTLPRWGHDTTVQTGDKRYNPGDTLRLVLYSDVPTNIEVSVPRTGWKRIITTSKDSLIYTVTLISKDIAAWLPHSPENKGVYISSDRNIGVCCYDMKGILSDATIIYPLELLGKEYIINGQYVTGSTSYPMSDPATFQIVATEDATIVDIEPSRPDWGANRQVTLQRGQTYLMYANSNPTGTVIKANKIIAVFNGANDQAANPALIPGFYGAGGGQNLYEQLLPVSQWGRDFYAVAHDASLRYTNPTWTRIVASVDGTRLSINGDEIVLNRGKWFDSISIYPLVIHADKSIAVTQMGSGMASPPGDFPSDFIMGDATYIQILSQEKMLSGRTVFSTIPGFGSPGKAGVTALDYITVIAPTSETSEIYLDGKSIASEFQIFKHDPVMSYAQILVSKWKHELWSTGRYHIYTYGWGHAEAYGNAAGVGLGARKAAISYASPCRGEDFELQGVAEKGAIQWHWDFADGTGEVATTTTGSNAAGDAITSVTHNFNKAGTYSVRLRVLYDWSSGVEDTVYRDVVVPELPQPTLAINKPTLCFGETTKIRASSGFKTYSWTHDGNVITADAATPAEITISKPGLYTVTVTNEKGCSNSKSIKVTYLPELIAGITGAASTCINSTEVYRAEGVISSGNNNIVVGWSATGGTLVSGQGTPIIGVRWTMQGTGLLKLEIRDAVTGCFKDTTISVEIGTGLNVAIAGNLAICDGTPTLLKAESGAGSDAEFEWYYNGNLLNGETV